MADETRSTGAEALAKLGIESDPPPIVQTEPSPEQVAATFEQKVAKMTQVLNRGILNDRLADIVKKATPKGRHGKPVRDREEDIIRYQNLGYTFDVNPDVKGMHGTADGRIRIGDLVIMTISEEDYQVLQQVNKNRVKRFTGGEARREYMSVSVNQQAAGIVPVDESFTTIGKGES